MERFNVIDMYDDFEYTCRAGDLIIGDVVRVPKNLTELTVVGYHYIDTDLVGVFCVPPVFRLGIDFCPAVDLIGLVADDVVYVVRKGVYLRG